MTLRMLARLILLSPFFLSPWLVTGCAKPPQAIATKGALSALVPMRYFAPQTWRLENNQFFMWKDPMNPNDASTAMIISKDIDDLNGQSIPVNKELDELEKRLTPLQRTAAGMKASAANEKKLYDSMTKALTDTGTQITTANTALNAEMAKPQPDPNVVSSLKAQVTQLSGYQNTLKKQVATEKTVYDSWNKNVASITAIIQPLKDRQTKVQAKSDDISNQGQQRVLDIMQVVEWYDQTSSVTYFEFQPGGHIRADLQGWSFDGNPRNFSTEPDPGKKPTISTVTYDPMGGIFIFDVLLYADDAQTKLTADYSFRLARINYDWPDGRNFFGGEVTRTTYFPDGHTEIRKGMAKCVDKNN